MKIKEIIKKVDKDDNFKSEVSLHQIAEDMHLNPDNIEYIEQDRLTSYYIGNWYCTDFYVGYKVYYFDDVPVAVTLQSGRKSNKNFTWISIESYKKVKEYIISFITYEDDAEDIDLCNMEEEWDSGYIIEYHSQLFKYHLDIPLYNGINVKIIEKHKGTGFNEEKQYQPSLVKIQHNNGKEEWIELKELIFPYNLK